MTGLFVQVLDAATGEDEGDLVRGAQAGDRAAFTVLVKRYQNVLFAVAFALTGRLSVAEDVVQETFLATWRRLKEIRQPDRFRSFLLGVARRKSLRALRDHRVAAIETGLSSLSDGVASPEPSPLDRAITEEEERFLWSALKEIPESYRVPLVLFYQEEQSTEKVAMTLELSGTNVRQRLWQGRRLLRDAIEERLEAALRRSRLGKAFTAGIVAALGAGDAAQASTSAGGAHPKSAVGAKGLIAVAAGALLIWGPRRVDVDGHAETRPVLASAGVSVADLAHASPRLRAAEVGGIPGAPLPASSQAFPGSRVLGFDFEDGILPEAFLHGYVVPGPPRPGNGYAMMATLMPWDGIGPMSAVRVETAGLHYRETLVLTFDYWLGADGKMISLFVKNGDKRCNYRAALKDVVRERWGRATFRLSSLAPSELCAAALEPGDQLLQIQIYGGVVGGSPFFVDNLAVSDDSL